MRNHRGLGRYILDGHRPVPCENLLRWARWLQTADRIVARTKIGPLLVSTVFLGLDHDLLGRNGLPLVFETMIFGTDAAGDFVESFCERYSTWGGAERGHRAAVEMAQEQLAESAR